MKRPKTLKEIYDWTLFDYKKDSNSPSLVAETNLLNHIRDELNKWVKYLETKEKNHLEYGEIYQDKDGNLKISRVQLISWINDFNKR